MPGTVVYAGELCRITRWLVVNGQTFAWLVTPAGRSAFLWVRFGDFIQWS